MTRQVVSTAFAFDMFVEILLTLSMMVRFMNRSKVDNQSAENSH